MGSKEPLYNLLLSVSAPFPYEIRSYGTRFAIETAYSELNTSGPFMKLASYIGVRTVPQNQTQMQIPMTAPVSMFDTLRSERAMQFFLPANFDNFSQIPQPLDGSIKIVEIPPAVGVVHRYSGQSNLDEGRSKAAQIIQQLANDGLQGVSTNFQFWAYDPPWTPAQQRRNEVWIEISSEQCEILKQKYNYQNNILQNFVSKKIDLEEIEVDEKYLASVTRERDIVVVSITDLSNRYQIGNLQVQV